MEIFRTVLIAFTSTLAGGLATYLLTLPKKQRESQKALYDRLAKTEEGVRSLLRSEIQNNYLKICNSHRKYAKPYEKQNVSYLYKAYTDMGGNSYISELFEQIMHKPVEPDAGKGIYYD